VKIEVCYKALVISHAEPIYSLDYLELSPLAI